MTWQGKRVLVTGGASFIGSHLTESLVGLGAEVRVVEWIDELAEGDLVEAATALALKAADAGIPGPLTARDAIPPTDAEAFEAQKSKIHKNARGQLSPVAAIEAVERCLTLTGEAAFAAERDAFLALKDSDHSAALRHIFFAERSV